MNAEPPRRFQLLLAAAVGCWLGCSAIFPGLFLFSDANRYGVWFLDSFAILASNDALGRGLDPYLPNPLDYFNRPHVYSHWWLYLHDLGLTRAHISWVGVTVVVAFVVSALWRLRPRSYGEVFWYFAVSASTPVLLACNRANNDLVIFALLAPVVPGLLHGSAAVRMMPVGLIAVAAGLKFYPASAGLLLLAATPGTIRENRIRLAVGVLALVLVGFNVAPDVAKIAALAPQPRGLLTFGAVNLPRSLGLTGGTATLAVLVAAVVAVAVSWKSRWTEGWVVAPADRNAWLSFILGAVVLAGCFFSGTSYAYRWVFALWLAPLLWRLPRDPAAPAPVRRLARLTGGLLVFVLWADGLLSMGLKLSSARIAPETAMRVAATFFRWEQLFTWMFFAGVLVFLTHFVREGWRRLWSAAA